MTLTRRRLGRILIGAVAGRCVFRKLAQASPGLFQVDRLLGEHPSEPLLDQYCGYRADAVVSLLGVNIFSRAGVGSGFALFRTARHGETTITTSRFAGGSFPQRAHNLNRLGLIQEVVVEQGSTPAEAAYFGFMTSSPEEGVAEARRSLQENRATQTYVAAEGHIDATGFRTTRTRFSFPAQFTWADRESLLGQVKSQFYSSESQTQEIKLAGSQWPGTLLHLVAKAIHQHPAKFDGDYVYNAKQFHLTLEKSMDPKAGAAFAGKGLTKRPQAVAVFRGVIRKEMNGKLTKFRLWIEEDSASLLPLRIELQARSFLALSFEQDPSVESRKDTREI